MSAPNAIKFVYLAAMVKGLHGCLHWPFSQDGRGYGQVWFRGKRTGAHRAVCRTVYGEPENSDMQVAHSCGNPICVNPDHLRWDSARGNHADKIKHNTHNKGERHGMSKLQELDVLCILGSADSYKVIAARHQISVSCVGLIKQGKRWPHIYRRFQEMQANEPKA